VGLDHHVHFRISAWQAKGLEKYHLDPGKIARRAYDEKIKSYASDEELIKNDTGDEGPSAVYVNAWHRVMPTLTTLLEIEDYRELQKSEEPLEDLKRLINWSLLKPVEIQQMGVFLQGGKTSKKILSNCIEIHLEEVTHEEG
jgi:hypothetical protein